MKTLKAIILALLICSNTFAQQTLSVYEGKINEKSTGNGFLAATIQLFPCGGASNREPMHYTSSNLNGEFRLKNINPGCYIAKISSLGYIEVTDSFELKEGQNITREFSLTESVFPLDQITVSSLRRDK